MKYAQLNSLVPGASGPDIDWVGLLNLIPELALLASTPQDPVHHAEGDVWTHTKMVCEALVSSADYRAAYPSGRFVLFYACLLHDISKPACTVVEADGRVSSAGHSKRGEVDVRVMLWRAGVPFDLRERICQIISVHQVPFYAISGNRSGLPPEFLVRKLSWEVSIRELAAVAEADIRGRVCKDQESILVAIELFRELAREDGCLDGVRAFPDAATRMAYFRSEGGMSPDYAFFTEPGSKVTVLSGLPASGKDSWVRERGGGLPVISFDDAREELGVKHGTAEAGKAIHLATDRAKVLLREKAPFVWNATHLSRQMRQKTLDLLYRYGAEVKIVYLEAPEAEIFRRNNARDSSLPNAAITKMLHRWEVPLRSEAHAVSYGPI